MKAPVVICLLSVCILVSRSHGLSVREAVDKVVSLFESHPDENEEAMKQCHVNQFPSVENFDSKKFAGDWYEIGRTPTKLPNFKSAVWRFTHSKDSEPLVFFFSARLENGDCLKPIPGEAISSSTNPGTLNFVYDGLKSRVEEELKLLQTDYTDVAVFYGCRAALPDGSCHKNAAFVSVLSRAKSVHQSLLETVSKTIKAVCINPHSVLPQNSADSCDLSNSDGISWKDGQEDLAWPVCKKTSICTLACPTCCLEDEAGCISCNCKEHYKNSSCIDDISCPAECDFGYQSGCKKCRCPEPVFYQAPSIQNAHADDSISDTAILISKAFECPTTCRTKSKDEELYCDCSNGDYCNSRPTEEDCKGDDEMYYFDTRTQTCHAFFGKCQASKNSFSSHKECMAQCADVCDLPPDGGPCKGNVQKFYYNNIQENCVTFIYGGCQGNENNFVTKDECRRRCPEKFSNVQQTSALDPVCNQKEERGPCTNNKLSYFYDKSSRNCRAFFYGGCEGNENNFQTEEACLAKCSSKTDGESDTADCMPITEECEKPRCELKPKKDGCLECKCGAQSLSISISTILMFLIVTFLLKRN